VHLAGQVANDTAQGIEGQTREVGVVDALLARCGSSKERILMVQVYLPNISRDFAGMNNAYEAWVAKGYSRRARPCRPSWPILSGSSRWL